MRVFLLLGLAAAATALVARVRPHSFSRHSSPVANAAAGGVVATSLQTTLNGVVTSPFESLEPDKEQFEWTKQWYPVGVTNFLDPSRPHAFTLLGRELVLWNNGPTVEQPKKFGLFKRSKQKQIGKWRAFVDSCPHRAAPLSEGRVEDSGELLCAYHAWRFDSSVSCGTSRTQL